MSSVIFKRPQQVLFVLSHPSSEQHTDSSTHVCKTPRVSLVFSKNCHVKTFFQKALAARTSSADRFSPFRQTPEPRQSAQLSSRVSLQVFFSAYIFNSNVMVKVATQPAENPIDVLSRKLHLGPGMGRDVPRLSLPGKLVFPRYGFQDYFSRRIDETPLFV